MSAVSSTLAAIHTTLFPPIWITGGIELEVSHAFWQGRTPAGQKFQDDNFAGIIGQMFGGAMVSRTIRCPELSFRWSGAGIAKSLPYFSTTKVMVRVCESSLPDGTKLS